MGFVAVVRSLVRLAIGLSVVLAGLGATLSFGVLAFIGIPILVVGLGLLSAAIEEV